MMRVSIPESVSHLTDIFKPYMFLDTSDYRWKLREDAPEFAIQAKKERDNWMREHIRKEGYGLIE